MKSKNLHYVEEKLGVVIELLKLSNREIAQKLEMSSAMVSQIQNFHGGRLRKHHLYAFSQAYGVPMEIFENQEINSVEEIERRLEKVKIQDAIFSQNHEILDKLIGTWYLYSYSSNQRIKTIWETKTEIYEDFRVEDMHQNRGELFIGKKQSMIIKESHNSKNLTSITFDNERITFEKFIFSRVSKSNGLNKELFNFGLFSRTKISLDEVEKILTNIDKVQLQVEFSLLERISSYIEIEG